VTSPDSLAVVLKALQHAGTPLRAAALKAALAEGGLAKADADKVWRSVQPRLKEHSNVVVDGLAYRWTDQARPMSALEALELLLKGGRMTAARKATLGEVVRSALAPSASASASDDADAAMRVRQAQADGLRQFADLAGEVEELIVNETAPAETVERVRAWSQRMGLDPIGRAGEETRFDRKLHKPIGAGIRDGATVFVVRPGYIWRTADRDVLLGKAVVEE
jgi:hypothetical protein